VDVSKDHQRYKSRLSQWYVPIVLKSEKLNLLEPSGSVQACSGIAFYHSGSPLCNAHLYCPYLNYIYFTSPSMMLRAPRNCSDFRHMLYMHNVTFSCMLLLNCCPPILYSEIHFSFYWFLTSSTIQTWRSRHQNPADNFLRLFFCKFLRISIILTVTMLAGSLLQ
jgi:hypothetical protein